MRELYARLERLDYGRDNELITVIRGEHIGAKYLFTDGKPVWISNKGEGTDPDVLAQENIYREKLGHVQTLVVCGAGPVGQAIVRIAEFLGWRVICVEDRREYAEAARSAGAHEVLCGEFGEMLSGINYDEDTFFAVVTREHSYDRACLDVILQHPFGYIGMMGSHRRTAEMRENLREAGWAEDVITRLHAPVGLPIKAQTPEEIAVSAAAEMILEKEKRSGRYHFPDDILGRILEVYRRQESEPDAHAVLATVTRQIGSTPRKPGARMLIYPDGSITGTIGGGSMEAEVIRSSVQSLNEPESFIPSLKMVDLTGRYGEYVDMLCGGITEIFCELI